MKLVDKIDDTIYSYATLRQIEIIDCLREHDGNITKAGKKLGIKRQSITSILEGLIKRAAKQGYSPSHDMKHAVPDGFLLKGTSTLYDSDGNTKIQWVKSSIDQERQRELITESIKAACEVMPRLKPISYKGQANSELLNQYTFTDYHIGMMAWHREGGDNWDIKIAESTLIGAFSHMIANSPNADACIINQLGDWLHFDGLKPVTPASGHVLDGDSRFHKMIRVAIRCLRTLIDMALSKHKTVHLICAEGNHDESSAHWLQELFTIL